MRIGKKKIVFSETVLVPDNEEFEFVVDFGDGSNLPVHIVFKPEDGLQGAKWIIKDNGVLVTFSGWVTSFGTTLSSPADIATLDSGEKVFLEVFHCRIASLNQAHIQIFVEEK